MPGDDEITSTELDAPETLEAEHSPHGTEVRLYVSVDSTTSHEL